jgi:hypothetical protein
MSDRLPPAFSLVAALADRFFVGLAGRAEHRRRDRRAAPRIAAGTPAEGSPVASAPRAPTGGKSA